MKLEWILIPISIAITILLLYGVKKATDHRNALLTIGLIIGTALLFPPIAILATIYATIKWFR